MNVPEFLNSYVTNRSPYVLNSDDEKMIKFEGVEKYIYNKLNSSKYKATKTTADYDKTVREKIHYCVINNLPIHIDLSTGATKNPNATSSPGIDWAEVFNVAFIRDYLKPLAAGYKYGVRLDYNSGAIFEEKVNLIPQKDVDLYDVQFTELINWYQKYLPENFKLNFVRMSDQVSKEQLYPLLDERIKVIKDNWKNVSPEVKADKLFRAARNIYLSGDEPNKEELILHAALAHDAFSDECWSTLVSPLWNEPDDISLGHRFTNGWAIHVRSAPGSTVNFWSGTGVLFKYAEKYVPTVLSPKQYSEMSSRFEKDTISMFSNNPVLSAKLAYLATITM